MKKFDFHWTRASCSYVGVSNTEEDKATHSIHWIYCLAAFISLALYPMAVEICKKAVDVVGTCSVPIPLASIVSQ